MPASSRKTSGDVVELLMIVPEHNQIGENFLEGAGDFSPGVGITVPLDPFCRLDRLGLSMISKPQSTDGFHG